MNRYPTVHCIHCQLMRCFPGGAETCFEWPGSSCPPPDAKWVPQGDDLIWRWDSYLGKFVRFESGIDSLWHP